jgi:hypothetical protein
MKITTEEPENWNHVLDKMSRIIRDSEMNMRKRGLSMPVEMGRLSWRMYGDYMRICLDKKPLSEHKAEIRAEFFERIPHLIKAADQEMTKKFGHIRDSQIGIEE